MNININIIHDVYAPTYVPHHMQSCQDTRNAFIASIHMKPKQNPSRGAEFSGPENGDQIAGLENARPGK